ncbi:hypothetical protein GQ53DRAFT_743744 [Thozetella sp. PMI_491]|nr:hypothetical protein GQ53DRAFT_743744 [Thozetella sp. PMI_491]
MALALQGRPPPLLALLLDFPLPPHHISRLGARLGERLGTLGAQRVRKQSKGDGFSSRLQN